MRRRLLAPLAVLPLAAVLLTGCGSGSSGSSTSSTSSAGASASASTGPAFTTGSALSASGSFGHKPTLTFPTGKPPATLQSKVVKQGDGPAVAKGDLLVADYLGEVWKGRVFDNSYDRHAPAAFPIGVGAVIPGWDDALVGVKAGSRVLLTIPPDKGYGANGNEKAGIKGTDTLVFVVDVKSSYGKDATADASATAQPAPSAGPTVTGPTSKEPTITVPAGTAQPKSEQTAVLAKGTGKALGEGLAIVQIEAVDWTGKTLGSTWKDGTPQAIAVGLPTQPGAFDALKGVPVGSRVLVTLPASASQPAIAAVVDIAAQVPVSA